MADACPTALPPNGVNLIESYGLFVVGTIFASILWGVACMQLFLYFFNYERDSVKIKALVAFVFAMDTANLAMTSAGMFPILVQHWGSVPYLSLTLPVLKHRTWVAGLVSASVQLYFGYRVWRLGRGAWYIYPVLTIVVLSAAWQVAGSITFTAWLYLGNSLDLLEGHGVPIDIAISARVSGAAADICIAATLIYLLWTRTRAELLRSHRLTYMIIMLTISTGLWTALFGIVDMALVIRYATGLQYTVLEWPFSGLYCNALLANLNARAFLARTASGAFGSDTNRNESEHELRRVVFRKGPVAGLNDDDVLRTRTEDHVPELRGGLKDAPSSTSGVDLAKVDY